MGAHFCNHCHKGPIPTLQGLRSHITQSAACRQACRRVAIQRPPVQPPGDLENADNSNDNTSDRDIEMNMLDSPGDFNDNNNAEFDPPPHQTSIQPAPSEHPAEQPSRRATVEDVEDEESDSKGRWIHDFPESAGIPVGRGETVFQSIKRKQESEGKVPWNPYDDLDEWELAKWLNDNVGHNAIDKHLKLNIVGAILANPILTVIY